ncbi:putative LuxR family regulator [Streptomyces scabiei 87.22]|uniref:Putative LuxR family regulator n=1 Tax=Streptomyces scabiei (strain 87.22) TaxID=680198 RepID=C9Z8X8_STRSW|nr:MULTISPECIES: helix-turn-helix transcriptional regulator [Streptomyces]MBP5875723.1 helix-turn-helix transcriptional regulator [Streptomyces sp. LBUM 1477]MDX2652181.1 helix-turn-helix transcriptional regulator [Streptomyces scabiei]MDX2725793.1 helix-turn-helix transcriptional regulator [Streptomyces scabiei]MDX2863912.1 helix-turn-helix transcriptional regulator [Streptomyces scabiei]MDX2881836.1 helix-turn-helix transcriptional regulator [Streptomyces scabiei]
MAGESLTFPWARTLAAEPLAAFIEDMWGAAGGGDDIATLDAMEMAVAAHQPPTPQDSVPCPLSQRETDVLTLIANGETYETAGAQLEVTAHTVRQYLGRIYGRLGARNAVHAAAIATHQGWLPRLDVPPPAPTVLRQSPKAWRDLYRARAAEMLARPGEPVLIGPYGSNSGARNTVRRIRLGLFEEFQPAGAFEATAVRGDRGQWLVRARYLGSAAPTQKGAAA